VTTGAAICEPFRDQAVAGPAVVVTIENTQDGVVFVLPGPPCTSDPLLQLIDPGGEPVRYRETVCDFSCDDHFAGECLCAADCALAPAIRLEPGGVFTYTWSGAVFVPVMPPAACFMMDCGETCEQQQQAAAGQYAFSTQVGASVPVCTDTPDLCMCTPGPEGWCELYNIGAMDIEGAATVVAEFAYPDETSVALVVQ
jgi:hypothetical protein